MGARVARSTLNACRMTTAAIMQGPVGVLAAKEMAVQAYYTGPYVDR